jgi:hypothetical protein
VTPDGAILTLLASGDLAICRREASIVVRYTRPGRRAVESVRLVSDVPMAELAKSLVTLALHIREDPQNVPTDSRPPR